MTNDNARLRQIRTVHKMASTGWKCEENQEGKLVLVGIHDVDGEPTDLAHICADNPADVQIIKSAHGFIGSLLDLLNRAFDEIKRLKAIEPQDATPPGSYDRKKDYTTNCAIQCGNPQFKAFLKARHNLGTATKEATETKVRELCGIASRRQLNEDPEKAEIWLKLNREFNDWCRYG